MPKDVERIIPLVEVRKKNTYPYGCHQRKELVPTCKVLYVFVTSILSDEIIEVIPIKECNQLSENVF